ncbi:MAG: hypothetical protein HGA61_02740 [Candidatus Moranbacteria bacterium]|nr:hypothetical protein [Candidatus Moranbacteria bacterium]
MQWKTPKNTDKYYWTAHVAEKMHYYGLSEQKVLGVIRNPKRTETGVAQDTVAVMLPVGNIKNGKAKPRWGRPSFGDFNNEQKNPEEKEEKENWNQEIWVMYQLRGSEASSKKQETCLPDRQANSKQKEEIIKNIKSLGKEKAKKLTKLMPKKLVIISAWRYPGVSPKNNPIPDEIFRELEELSNQ